MTAAAGGSPNLKFRKSDNKLFAAIGTSTLSATGLVVAANIWYRIDMKGDVGTGTRSCTIEVHDGTTLTNLGTVNEAIAATTLTQLRFGGSCGSELITSDTLVDDLITGNGTTEYPFGAGDGIGIFLVSDGAHNFDQAGRFIYDTGSSVPTGATDTYSYINHRLASVGVHLIQGSTIQLGQYLEWNFGGMPSALQVKAVEIVSGHHSDTTTANKQNTRVAEGGSTLDHLVDGDLSNTTITNASVHYNGKPSGGGWTDEAINATKFRWYNALIGGTLDASPQPRLDGVIMEVDYLPGGGGGGGPTQSFEMNVPTSIEVGSEVLFGIMSKGHTDLDPSIVLTDNETGNPWVKKAEDPQRRASLWYKRATALTLGRKVTVSGLIAPHAAVMAVIRESWQAGEAITNVDIEYRGNARNKGGFTPAFTDSMICMMLYSMNGNMATNPQTDDVVLVKRGEDLETEEGTGAAVMFACETQFRGPRSTGQFTWDQILPDNYVCTFAIKPRLGDGEGWTKVTLVDASEGVVEKVSAMTLFGTDDGHTYQLALDTLKLGGHWLSKQYGKPDELITLDRVQILASSVKGGIVGVSYTFDGGLTYSDEVLVEIKPANNSSFSGSGWDIATGHLFQVRLRLIDGDMTVHGVDIYAQPRGRTFTAELSQQQLLTLAGEEDVGEE